MAEDKQKNLADIARKKRYLHLIEKMHSGTPLTKPEIRELEEFEATPLEPPIVKTIEEVAKTIGVAYRTVQRWKKEGMPVTEQGYYDLDVIQAWHEKRSGIESETEGKAFWEEKIRKYRATLLELEIKKVTGDLIPREVVERDRVTRIIAVKRAFFALPKIMAPLLSMKEPLEIESILHEAIGEIVDEFTGVRKFNDTELLLDNGTGSAGLDENGSSSVDAPGENNGQ